MHICSIDYILKSFSRVSCPVLAYSSSFAGVRTSVAPSSFSYANVSSHCLFMSTPKIANAEVGKVGNKLGKAGRWAVAEFTRGITDGRSHGGGEKETKAQASLEKSIPGYVASRGTRRIEL